MAKNKSFSNDNEYFTQYPVEGNHISSFRYTCGYGKKRSFNIRTYDWPSPYPESSITRLMENKVITKLTKDADAQSDILAAWIERHKSVELLTDILGTALKTAIAIKRRDPKIVRKIVSKNPQWKDVAKTPANLWLGYHFGVVPTYHDIHSLMESITKGFQPLKISASTSSTYDVSFDYWPGIGWKNAGRPPTTQGSGRFTYIIKSGATISVQNANTILLSRYGLTSPASVAYELTPWSWAVDYFVNVGQVISNIEPRFPGYKIVDGYTTRYIKGGGHRQYNDAAIVGPSKSRVYANESWTTGTMSRSSLNLSYALAIQASPLNLQRASYLAGALTQILTGFRK